MCRSGALQVGDDVIVLESPKTYRRIRGAAFALVVLGLCSAGLGACGYAGAAISKTPDAMAGELLVLAAGAGLFLLGLALLRSIRRPAPPRQSGRAHADG
jgi:hypothetical protein